MKRGILPLLTQTTTQQLVGLTIVNQPASLTVLPVKGGQRKRGRHARCRLILGLVKRAGVSRPVPGCAPPGRRHQCVSRTGDGIEHAPGMYFFSQLHDNIGVFSCQIIALVRVGLDIELNDRRPCMVPPIPL